MTPSERGVHLFVFRLKDRQGGEKFGEEIRVKLTASDNNAP